MSAKNLIVRSVAPKSLFESAVNLISSAVSFNQGDLLILDTSGHLLAHAAAESDGATFLGIARTSIASGKIIGPYTGVPDADVSAAITDVAGPQYGVVAKLVLKTGDSVSPGSLVYLDPSSGTQNVQASGTKAIGIVQSAAVSSAAAGTQIEVLLGCRAPVDALLF